MLGAMRRDSKSGGSPGRRASGVWMGSNVPPPPNAAPPSQATLQEPSDDAGSEGQGIAGPIRVELSESGSDFTPPQLTTNLTMSDSASILSETSTEPSLHNAPVARPNRKISYGTLTNISSQYHEHLEDPSKAAEGGVNPASRKMSYGTLTNVSKDFHGHLEKVHVEQPIVNPRPSLPPPPSAPMPTTSNAPVPAPAPIPAKKLSPPPSAPPPPLPAPTAVETPAPAPAPTPVPAPAPETRKSGLLGALSADATTQVTPTTTNTTTIAPQPRGSGMTPEALRAMASQYNQHLTTAEDELEKSSTITGTTESGDDLGVGLGNFGLLNAMVADEKPKPEAPPPSQNPIPVAAKPKGGLLSAMVADVNNPKPAPAALQPPKPKVGVLSAMVADSIAQAARSDKSDTMSHTTDGDMEDGPKKGLLGGIYKDVLLKQHAFDTNLTIDVAKREFATQVAKGGWTEEDEAKLLGLSAYVIQKRFRNWKRLKKEYKRLRKLRRRTVFLQTNIRRFLAVERYRRSLEIIINCQRAYRYFHLRRRWPSHDEMSRSLFLLKVKKDRDDSLLNEQKTFGDMMEEIRNNDKAFGKTFFPSFVSLPLTFTNILGKTNTRDFFPSGLITSMHKLQRQLQSQSMPDRIVSCTVGATQIFVVTAHGTVHSSGVGQKGELGYLNNEPTQRFTLIQGLYSRCVAPPSVRVVIRKLSTGDGHTMALDDVGRVFGWGDNRKGQCGYETATNTLTGECFSHTPRLVKFDKSLWVNDVACGGDFTVGVLKGMLYAWGDKKYLGQGKFYKGGHSHKPRAVKLGGISLKFMKVTCGINHVAGAASNGHVYCWGVNEFAQCGQKSRTSEGGKLFVPAPEEVPGLSNILEISAGGFHTVALSRTGEVFCWGWNKFGQCGKDPCYSFVVRKPHKVNFTRDGRAEVKAITVAGSGGLKAMSISAGDTHCLAMVKDDCSVWKWGAKVDGLSDFSDVNYIPSEMDSFRDEPHWGKRTSVATAWSRNFSLDYVTYEYDPEARSVNRKDYLRSKSPEKMSGERLFIETHLDKSNAQYNTIAKLQKIWNRLKPKDKAIWKNKAAINKNKYGKDVDTYSDVSVSSSIAERNPWNNDHSFRSTLEENPFKRDDKAFEHQKDMSRTQNTIRTQITQFGVNEVAKRCEFITKTAKKAKLEEKRRLALRKKKIFQRKRSQINVEKKLRNAENILSLLSGDWAGMDDEGEESEEDEYGMKKKGPPPVPMRRSERREIEEKENKERRGKDGRRRVRPPPPPLDEEGLVISPIKEGDDESSTISSVASRTSSSRRVSLMKSGKKPPPPSAPPPPEAVQASAGRRRKSLLERRGSQSRRRGSSRLSITSLLKMDMDDEGDEEVEEDEPPPRYSDLNPPPRFGYNPDPA
ncbi:hypothetical protein TrVE_jg11055 [Triparma verrucosa]|uniref:RCC1-like domain-containing protein n=1 Tax=Triparma verrucosa TaxID=1606542 RepID=A0A9W7EWV4_9STRA|nr:hypothetical protein TrVE_jg11055 [Triparma verrucosa]